MAKYCPGVYMCTYLYSFNQDCRVLYTFNVHPPFCSAQILVKPYDRHPQPQPRPHSHPQPQLFKT